MSRDRTHVGKLFLIARGEEEMETVAKGFLNGELNTKYYSTYLEELTSEYYYYIVIQDCLFKLVDNEFGDDYCCLIRKISDTEFEYFCHYYDGATCLNEELENELQYIKI